MAAAGDDLETASGHQLMHLPGSVRRREPVALADEHQRRAGDRGKMRPRIDPVHDRRLLTGEGFGSVGLAAFGNITLGSFLVIALLIDTSNFSRAWFLILPAIMVGLFEFYGGDDQPFKDE